jgi:hypothetical protein
MMGAMTAGIGFGLSTGVIGSCSQSPFAGAFKVFGDEYMQKLAITTCAGAVAGGVTAELFGGSFGEGAAMGAASAAAGYVVSEHNEEFLRLTAATDLEKGSLVLIGGAYHYRTPWGAVSDTAVMGQEADYDLRGVNLIHVDEWEEYKSGVCKEVKAFWPISVWRALIYDTSLPGYGSLYNNHSRFYLQSLNMFAKGYEINYVGQGMLYHRLWVTGKWANTVFPNVWKGANIPIQNKWFSVTGQVYHMPTDNEKIFTDYGYRHYKP